MAQVVLRSDPSYVHGELKRPKAIGVTGEGNFTLVGKIGKGEQHEYANGIVDTDGRDCDPRHAAVS